MNWFRGQAATTDTFIKDTVYPGLPSDADGIDLRIEMNHILYGNSFRKPLGHWVNLRIFDRTRRSKYWNPISKEAINGPGLEYEDVLVRTRRVPYFRVLDMEENIKSATLNEFYTLYYFEWNVPIKVGDQIYNIDVDDHTNKPTDYNFVDKQDIIRVHPYRLENGNVQYLVAYCELQHITY